MIIDTDKLRAWANQDAAQDRFDLARQNPFMYVWSRNDEDRP